MVWEGILPLQCIRRMFEVFWVGVFSYVNLFHLYGKPAVSTKIASVAKEEVFSVP